MNETEYLAATKANKEALDESIKQLEAGEGVKIALEGLWK